MARKAQWPPPVYHHKPSGKDRVRIWKDGSPQDITLGEHDSPESQAEYARLVAELSRRGTLPARSSTLWMLARDYLKHAKTYYGKKQYHRVYTALSGCLTLYGHLPAEEFGPKALKTVQEGFAGKYGRRYCNQLLSCIKIWLRWAVSEELLAEEALRKLECVKGLRKKGTAASEPASIQPVAWDHVEAVLPLLLPPVQALIHFQRWTGCRPGEACLLRPCDLVRPWRTVEGVELWLFTLDAHKGAWRGALRVVPVPPQAQEVLLPYLQRDPQSYCFSPAEARAIWEAQKREARKSKVQPSQLERRVQQPRKKAGERYSTESYGRAIRRACLKAGIPVWAPNQLRHLVGTEVETLFDRDAARCVLGHTSPQTTSIYAESVEKAALTLARLHNLNRKS